MSVLTEHSRFYLAAPVIGHRSRFGCFFPPCFLGNSQREHSLQMHCSNILVKLLINVHLNLCEYKS